MDTPDYYELLQISPNAEPETIQRMYRFFAARFHPDNPETGNDEKFFVLTQAYAVLSSPERRAEYDAQRKTDVPSEASAPVGIDFMDSVKGELNRRLAMLSILYFQRRANPYAPEVSFLEIESRLGLNRELLQFTVWYLTSKGYVGRSDSWDFILTADGVDFVETQRANLPVLNKLLTEGSLLSKVEHPSSAAPDPSSRSASASSTH